MSTTVDEIADGIYRLSTWVPDVAPPAGFTFNQFLIDAVTSRCSSTPGRARCSRSCPKRSRRSCRSSSCAGSRSVTSKPTSAAR